MQLHAFAPMSLNVICLLSINVNNHVPYPDACSFP